MSETTKDREAWLLERVNELVNLLYPGLEKLSDEEFDRRVAKVQQIIDESKARMKKDSE